MRAEKVRMLGLDVKHGDSLRRIRSGYVAVFLFLALAAEQVRAVPTTQFRWAISARPTSVTLS